MTVLFPDFLPTQAQALTEATSIALAQRIQRQAIATPLSKTPILTSYVQDGMKRTGQPPIVFLHGFDSSVMEVRRLLPQLSQWGETWAIDLLGFGFTDRPLGLEFTPAAIQQHLYATWKTLIQRPIILIGASMGGAAAIDFALTYPDAVEHLVLIDSAGFAKGRALKNPAFIPLTYAAAEFLRNPWVRDRISKTAYCDPSYASRDAAICAALHLACPDWRRAMVSFTRSGGYIFLRDRIADLTQPTLVIWGKQDRILGTADADRFDQVLKGRSLPHQLVWMDQCGHVPHLEQPTLTAQAIQHSITMAIGQE
jgi:pimeloyl-ACP methyl ester carboxylesterase